MLTALNQRQSRERNAEMVRRDQLFNGARARFGEANAHAWNAASMRRVASRTHRPLRIRALHDERRFWIHACISDQSVFFTRRAVWKFRN